MSAATFGATDLDAKRLASVVVAVSAHPRSGDDRDDDSAAPKRFPLCGTYFDAEGSQREELRKSSCSQ